MKFFSLSVRKNKILLAQIALQEVDSRYTHRKNKWHTGNK